MQVLPQHYTSGVITCELVVLPSWHCFRNPDALDPRLCLVRNVRFVGIEEDTRRAVARHRSEIWLWVLLNKYRAGLQLLLPQMCEMCFVIYYQEQKKKWWENVIFTIHVLSRLTALLTWAASLGWTSAVTCCNTYREYHAPVVFTLSYEYVHRFCSSYHHANCLPNEM